MRNSKIKTQKFHVSRFTFNSKSGQALIMLMIFVVIAIIITSGSVILMAVNSSATTKLQGGTEALYVAEAGAENALLRLIRNPNYSGEVLSVDGGTATITVTGSSVKTIISEGRFNNFTRKIEVVTNYNDNIFTVSTWRELF